jgi:hypothetical protein
MAASRNPGSRSSPPAWLLRIAALPRLGKMLLLAAIALAVVLLVTPTIDYVYLTQFFDFNTRMLPALVSMAVGVAVYALGWWLLLWDDEPRWRGLSLYFALGIFALIAVVILTLYGFFTAAQG